MNYLLKQALDLLKFQTNLYVEQPLIKQSIRITFLVYSLSYGVEVGGFFKILYWDDGLLVDGAKNCCLLISLCTGTLSY